jgi:hypothetical protein
MAGDCADAIALGERAVAELRQLDQPSNLGLALSNLCAALLLCGQPERARASAAEAWPLMSRSGWSYLLVDSLALLAAGQGRPVDAARLLGVADAWYAAHQEERQPNEAALERRSASALDAALGPAVHAAERAGGRGLADADQQRIVAALVDDGF